MPQDICERTLEHALSSIKLYQSLQEVRDGAAWVIAKQFLRSATAVGANIEEAQAGESRSDFVHKYRIALKEARESSYWLRLLIKSELVRTSQAASLLKETHELIAILTTIINKAKPDR